MINIKDILVLDDENEYVVVSKANYNDKIYYYIINNNDNRDFKFCYQENDELVEIEDDKLIKELIPLFFNSVKEVLIDLDEGAM